MSYRREPDEPAVDFRERIQSVWEQLVAPWEFEFRTRGRRVASNAERVAEIAALLDEYADLGLIPRRDEDANLWFINEEESDEEGSDEEESDEEPPEEGPLMMLSESGPYPNNSEESKFRKRKPRKVAGVVFQKYVRTVYGEYVFRNLMRGGVTPVKTARWLASAYMDVLPTLPPRVEGRTYLQVAYITELWNEEGKKEKEEAKSRPFPEDSTFYSVYTTIDPTEPTDEDDPEFDEKWEKWSEIWSVITSAGHGSDIDIVQIDLEVDPNHVAVHFLAPQPVGGGKSAGIVTKLDDGTIIRDYDCSAGTCLVSVANRMGGDEIPWPLKWSRRQEGFTRANGLPMSALSTIEAITKRTLPVVDLATREVLRQATPGLAKGIGEAIGYDEEKKHFTHIISFAPSQHKLMEKDKLKSQSFCLTELEHIKAELHKGWRAKWGLSHPGGVEEQNYKQTTAVVAEAIKNAKKAKVERDEKTLLIAYDYETVYDKEGITRPYCISWCCLDLSSNDPLAELPKTMKEFKAAKDRARVVASAHCTEVFLEWLRASTYVKSFNHIILEAFNGSRFDASFVAEIAHSRRMLLPKSLLIVGGGLLKGSLSGGFQFHDISRFLCGSLAYNCKAFAVERAKVDGFDHSVAQDAQNKGRLKEWCQANSEKLNEYSAFDVLALAELSWKAYKAFRECPGSPDMFAHPTIASMAYKTLKSELKKVGEALPSPPANEKMDKFMRSAMYAGRVQMMRGRGTVRGKLCMYDIASSYPYAMLNQPFPAGDYIETDHEMEGKMGIYRCKIHRQLSMNFASPVNVTVIPLRAKDKPLDWTHAGEMEATITSVDIAEIRAGGNRVDVFEGVYWENTSMNNFRPVLGGLEIIKGEQDRLKREVNARYNPALREASKLFMNSLSGKVAQRMKRRVTVLSSDYTTTADTLDKLEQDSVNLSIFGNSLLITGAKVEPFNVKHASPCFLACFIYAYARQRLRAALLCGAYYCDTDSALFDAEGAQRFRESYPEWLTPPGADKKFGEWEEEFGQNGSKEVVCHMVQPKNYFAYGEKDPENPCPPKCDCIICKPKIRSKGVGARDVIITYNQAIKVMSMNEVERGKFCEENKNNTMKSISVAKEIYKAGVESRPIYALCMQFRRECGAGVETNDESLGGLFSLRQSYTIKQVGGTATDKSEWESLKGLKNIVLPVVAPVPAIVKEYTYIPSTYELRKDWYNEPCALRRKKCLGGEKCHHCNGTPRKDWFLLMQDKEEDLLAIYSENQ